MKDEECSMGKKSGIDGKKEHMTVGKYELLSVEGNVQLHIYKLLVFFSFLITRPSSNYIY